ncbi:hypothetical protein PanWU01x14_151890, partial [Parasponia andersonii]
KMAASFEISKTTCHARSSSFPSRSHPSSTSVEEQLSRLRTSSQATTSSSLCHRLSGLKHLHESLGDLLQLQQTKQALSREENKKHIEQVLKGSVQLLDACGTTRDVLSQMRQCLQQLQSSLRRKRGSESVLDNEINAYVLLKKKLAKMICKCFRSNSMTTTKKDYDLFSAVSVLNEVQEITSQVLQSLLSFVSRPNKRSRSIVVSKLFQSKKVSCEGEVEATELEKMDAELMVLKSKKDIKIEQVKQVLKGLESLESNIQELEEELERIFRHLMKTRVSLLNVFTH